MFLVMPVIVVFSVMSFSSVFGDGSDASVSSDASVFGDSSDASVFGVSSVLSDCSDASVPVFQCF